MVSALDTTALLFLHVTVDFVEKTVDCPCAEPKETLCPCKHAGALIILRENLAPMVSKVLPCL